MLAGLIQRQIDVFQFAGAAAVAVSLIVITLVIVGAMLRSSTSGEFDRDG